MHVQWLSLRDIRTYGSLDWSPDPGINVLIGPNGAGKTNLLEAIAYLATLKSLRGAPDAAMISDGARQGVIRGEVASQERSRLVEVELSRDRPRRAQLDKSRLGRLADLVGVVRVVAFLPDDLDLVKRSPTHRRRLLDDIAATLWPSAHVDQAEYERALRQRNAFLKSGSRDRTTLEVWDERLAASGGRVLARRADVIEAMVKHLDDAYREIAGGGPGVEMRYHPSWHGELSNMASVTTPALAKALATARETDYHRRVTTVGPHRDDPVLVIEGRDSRTHASQGEQRSLALAIKLAAHRVVRDVSGDQPVLLFDDVFSELDPKRAAALTAALPAHTQTMITSARPEDVPLAGRTWEVAKGSVS